MQPEPSPIQAEQLHDRYVESCNSNHFHLPWGRHDGLTSIYPPKLLEFSWERSPRNPPTTQKISHLSTEIL